MAQVKPELKDQGNSFFNFPVMYNNISLQLCELKNLRENKMMLLGHTCYDTNGSAWKASARRTLFSSLFGSWADWPAMFILLLGLDLDLHVH